MLKKENLKILIYLIVAVVISVGVSISVQSLLAAWTAPTVAPPGGNVAAPINEGSSYQVKSGILGVTDNFYAMNNVGIGTNNPQAKLEVNGIIKSTPTDSPGICDNNLKGGMYFDASENKPCYCDGSNWLTIDNNICS